MKRLTALASVLALVGTTSAALACDPATRNDCNVTVSTQGVGDLDTGVVIGIGLGIAALIVLTDEKGSGSH